MTPKEALEYLKNRVTTLSLNHKIGSRDIAKAEVKDIVMGIESHVIPTFEHALTEFEELKRDVARYFEIYHNDLWGEGEFDEYVELQNKLSKVGKEE